MKPLTPKTLAHRAAVQLLTDALNRAAAVLEGYQSVTKKSKFSYFAGQDSGWQANSFGDLIFCLLFSVSPRLRVILFLLLCTIFFL